MTYWYVVCTPCAGAFHFGHFGLQKSLPSAHAQRMCKFITPKMSSQDLDLSNGTQHEGIDAVYGAQNKPSNIVIFESYKTSAMAACLVNVLE